MTLHRLPIAAALQLKAAPPQLSAPLTSPSSNRQPAQPHPQARRTEGPREGLKKEETGEIKEKGNGPRRERRKKQFSAVRMGGKVEVQGD